MARKEKNNPRPQRPWICICYQKKINARSIAFLVVLTYHRGLNYDYYYRASENITLASKGLLNNADSDTFPRNSSFCKGEILKSKALNIECISSWVDLLMCRIIEIWKYYVLVILVFFMYKTETANKAETAAWK